ncbi:PREDICTED: GATA transcription factor 9-like [Tarenaya hassleriana]|uniref:GATA transcription factor 9-like n=1 Tax=Tarenaya hassleriana TaxID=28532 RepID=UPI00053C2395|nr:PREDICTED: GATA transcription factor 9-like [Tarenaya hassleriana]
MEFYVGNYFSGVAEKNVNSGENFAVEDLLDFSNEDMISSEGMFLDNVNGSSTDSSTVTVVDSCNSSFSGSFGADSQFSGELCVPYDEAAELEWLSNFVEESFTGDQLHILPSGSKPPTPESSSSSSRLPGKARSKRSRAAPGDWSTRFLPLSSEKPKKRETGDEGNGRKCLHCATEKTPQWRTGPMGPKTLCNACGVRYKSGRLVPEYRPAASPTFVSTKHSNSHRKVLELRRQKEFQGPQFIDHTSLFPAGDDIFLHPYHLAHSHI